MEYGVCMMCYFKKLEVYLIGLIYYCKENYEDSFKRGIIEHDDCNKIILILYSSLLISDYLLSNNHVNSIIVHKFDFSDEEVMAYYISFLKTLSLKLNNHTIHFFYNEVITI